MFRRQNAAASQFHLAAAGYGFAKHRPVVEHSDLVLFQQMRDARRQPAGDIARAFHNSLQIDADLAADGDAEILHLVDRVAQFRCAKKRLCRNAPPVQADAAKMLALDKRHLHLQLRRADRGNIAAGAAAYDHKVEIRLACHDPVLSPYSNIVTGASI